MADKKKGSVKIGQEVILLVACALACLITGGITGVWWLQAKQGADLGSALSISLPLCGVGLLFGAIAYRVATWKD